MILSAYQIVIYVILVQGLLSLMMSCTKKHLRGHTPKVHVYVLAGQSNMEGHGEVDRKDDAGNQKNGTLLYQLQDPRTRDEFKILWDEDHNEWTKLNDVKVWFQQTANQEGINGTHIPGKNLVDYSAGDLTVGFGAGGLNPNSKFFGPELGFGFNIEVPKGDKVLLVKTAWGGRDLAQKFRPPSSAGIFDPFCRLPACDPFQVGHYYMVMLQDVSKIMRPGVIGQMFPDLEGMKVEISGFAWHQGWNDGCDVNMTAAYETNLVHLIQDLRRVWNNPHLPVSIGVSGFNGWDTNGEGRTPPDCWDGPNASKIDCQCANGDGQCRRIDVILSQFAAANITKHPELECCVEAVETRDFYRPPEFSPMNQGYHFNHNAETHYLIGKAMAEGMNRARRERQRQRQRTRHSVSKE